VSPQGKVILGFTKDGRYYGIILDRRGGEEAKYTADTEKEILAWFKKNGKVKIRWPY